MLLFVGNSLRTVAGSAVRSVPLDLQGPVSSYGQARAVAGEVRRQSGVLQASRDGHRAADRRRTPGRRRASPAPAPAPCSPCRSTTARTSTPSASSQGALRPGAVVLDQQMAATLQAHIGDRVTLKAPGGGGAAGLPGLRRGARHRARPALPAAEPPARPGARAAAGQRRDHAAGNLRLDARARSCPRSPPRAVGANAQPGAQTGVQWQVQTQLDPVALSGGSPSSALDARHADAQPDRTHAARARAVRRQPLGLAEHRRRRRPLRRDALHHARRSRRADRARARLPRRARHRRSRPPRPRAAARARGAPARPAGAGRPGER